MQIRSAQGARDQLSLNHVVSLVDFPMRGGPAQAGLWKVCRNSSQTFAPPSISMPSMSARLICCEKALAVLPGFAAEAAGAGVASRGRGASGDGARVARLVRCASALMICSERRAKARRQGMSTCQQTRFLSLSGFPLGRRCHQSGFFLPDGIGRRARTASPSSNSQNAPACSRPACSSPARAWCRQRGGRTWPSGTSPRSLPLSWTWIWTTWGFFDSRRAGGAVKTIAQAGAGRLALVSARCTGGHAGADRRPHGEH